MEKTITTLPQTYFTRKRSKAKKILRNNSMTAPEYLLWNIICGVLYYFSFMNHSFVSLNGKSELSSRIILTVIVTVWFAAGLTLTFFASRTLPSVAGNIFPPYILYFLLTCQGGFHAFLLWTITGCTMLTVVLSLQKLLHHTRKGTGYSFIQLVHYYSIKSRNTIAMVFAACLVVTTIWTSAVSAFVPKNLFSRAPVCCTIENSADKLEVFQEYNWSAATEIEKIQGLQTMADIETTNLGLPDSLTVDVQSLKKTALACYHHKTHTIHFNSAYFNDTTNLTALNAVLHECYHAQQYSMIDTYDTLTEEQKKLSAFKYLEQYKTELANYEDGEEDYSLYRNQQIESDAFAYAKQAMIPYKNHLAERRNEQ